MALKGSRKAYDSFARERVLEKLEGLWKRFPSLSQERMAGEIADFRGYDFNRKNFQRLKSGPIPDSRVNDIVKWITAKHDPTFEEMLASDVEFFVDPAASRSIVFSQQEWLPIKPKDADALVAQWHLEGLPDGFLNQCSMAYRALGFMRNARALRITPLRPRSFTIQPIHVLQIGDCYHAISGNRDAFARDGLSTEINLDQHNILDFIRFYFDVMDADQNLHLISSKSDLLYYLLETTSLSFFEASLLVDTDYHSLIEPPMVERDVNSGHFRVRLDCIGSKFYRRLFLSVQSYHSISIDRIMPVKRISVAGMEDVSRTFEPERVVIDIKRPDDTSALFGVLASTQTGSNLVKSSELGDISFCAVRGATNNFAYDADSRTIIHTINDLASYGLGYEALSLALALRFADQHLLGLGLPNPDVDMMNYATLAHGKNLDALVCMCKVALELEASPLRYKEALSYLEDRNLIYLYEGVRMSLDTKKLLEIYKKY